jgi:hypothetical protein
MNHMSSILLGFTLIFAFACGSKDNEGDDWTAGLQDITDWIQIDRMGNPLVNVVLIDASTDKDDFNFFDPTDDLANFKSVFEAKLASLRSEVLGIWGAADAGTNAVTVADFIERTLPDVLTIDIAADTAYPNGRALIDDASDLFLGLVFNYGNVVGGGTGISDGVSSDLKFSKSFPYLPEVHMTAE